MQQPSLEKNSAATVQLPVLLVAEVQDSLLMVVHDLSRLDGLLAHTMENLLERFTTANTHLADATPTILRPHEKIFQIYTRFG